MYTTTVPLILFISFLAFLLYFYFNKAEINDMSKLEERNGIFYKIKAKEPYTGIGRTYCRKGSLLAEKRYKNGKENGITTLYYENGQIEQKSHWKNGKRRGLTTLYYQNGRIQEETEWKNNKKDGLSRFYNEKGDLQEEFSLKDGKLIQQAILSNIENTISLRNKNQYKRKYPYKAKRKTKFIHP